MFRGGDALVSRYSKVTMRRWLLLGLATGFLIGLSEGALPASIECFGGSVSLTVASAVAGHHPDPVVDVSSGLRYMKTNGVQPTQKITVASAYGGSHGALTVEAINVGDGDAAGEVTVSGTARDLVTGIDATSFATCDLRYTVTSHSSHGTGIDSHTITFTITVQ